MEYRALCVDEINTALFAGFIRRQEVTKCWRKEGDEWVIREDPFIDDWSAADYQTLVDCLKHTVMTGGFVYAAFCSGVLKGFVAVEPTLFGGPQRYLDLSSLHVSREMRGNGIGTQLFQAAKRWAREHGRKSCTYRPIRLWRAKVSIRRWVASRQRCMIRPMSRRNPLIASWSARWRRKTANMHLIHEHTERAGCGCSQ